MALWKKNTNKETAQKTVKTTEKKTTTDLAKKPVQKKPPAREKVLTAEGFKRRALKSL